MKCAACLADADCAASGTFCDLTAGSCKALLPQGATCDRAAQCTAAACASDKACGLPEGAACAATTECREGQCSAGVCRVAITTGTTKDMVRISGGGGACNIGGGGEGQLTGLFAFGALALWVARRRRGR